MRYSKGGFTLVELLVVVTIIGLLAIIVLPKYTSAREKAYDAVAVEEIRNLIHMSESYYALHLEYPDDIADLTDYTPSRGIVVTGFNRETTEDDVIVVHIHLHHENSPHYFHTEYPVEDIEKRDR